MLWQARACDPGFRHIRKRGKRPDWHTGIDKLLKNRAFERAGVELAQSHCCPDAIVASEISERLKLAAGDTVLREIELSQVATDRRLLGAEGKGLVNEIGWFADVALAFDTDHAFEEMRTVELLGSEDLDIGRHSLRVNVRGGPKPYEIDFACDEFGARRLVIPIDLHPDRHGFFERGRKALLKQIECWPHFLDHRCRLVRRVDAKTQLKSGMGRWTGENTSDRSNEPETSDNRIWVTPRDKSRDQRSH